MHVLSFIRIWPHTNKASLYQVCCPFICPFASSIWFCCFGIFQWMVKIWKSRQWLNFSIIEIYGIWKGWAEVWDSKQSSGDRKADSGSSGQWQWMVSAPSLAAAASLHVGGHQGVNSWKWPPYCSNSCRIVMKDFFKKPNTYFWHSYCSFFFLIVFPF